MSRKDEFLKKQKILRLSTIDQNGYPHIVPVWYLYSAKKFYIGTHTKTIKAKNIKKNKHVSFCVDKGVNSPIFGVMGQGTAKMLLEKKMVQKFAKKILLRYFKSMQTKSAKELFEMTDCIIEITPKKVTTWSY